MAKSYSLPLEKETVEPARKSTKRGDVGNYSPPIVESEGEEASDMEIPSSYERVEIESGSSSEITTIPTNTNSEATENNTEEASEVSEAEKPKETKLETVTTPKKVAIPEKETKAAKTPPNNNNLQPRVSRKRRATQRNGIDVVMAINEESENEDWRNDTMKLKQ